jgi:uncharacterized damage-inducible protein DinB
MLKNEDRNIMPLVSLLRLILLRRYSKVELKDLTISGLNFVKQSTARAIDGLSREELMWRPAEESNSMGIILFHMARSEDRFIQGRVRETQEVWESGKWHLKLNLPESEGSAPYTAEQVNSFVVPELENLMEYADAVRTSTIQYLKDTPIEDFERIINMPRRGDIKIGDVIALALVHLAQHAGELSYLRGMQRGMNK